MTLAYLYGLGNYNNRELTLLNVSYVMTVTRSLHDISYSSTTVTSLMGPYPLLVLLPPIKLP